MNQEKGGRNHRQGPFEHESHPAHGKIQNASPLEIQAPHPSIGNQEEVNLNAGSQQVFENERQGVDRSCDDQQFLQ